MELIKLKNKNNLSERANKYLFLQCLNNIDYAINQAREVATITPTSENISLLNELENFHLSNVEYYSNSKLVFNKK